MSTSALPTLRQSLRQLPVQWALLDLNCRLPTKLDLNRKVLSAVGTDLNLGPSELSGHRWTSTWDLPSSVGTAGPQRPDRLPEDKPDRTPERMSDRMPEDMPDKMPQDKPDRMPEDMPDRMSEDMPDRMPGRMPEDMPEHMPGRMPEDMPEP